LLQDNLPCLRKAALDCWPEMPKPPFAPFLPKLLRDADVAVRTSACWACLNVKSKELRGPLLEVLSTARDDKLLYAAHTVAYDHEMVPRVEVLRALVDRLDEDGMSRKCLGYLRAIVGDRSSLDYKEDKEEANYLKADEVNACKKAWLKFLDDRAKELTTGKTYPFDDATLPIRELFPRVKFWRDPPEENKGKS
jgi:hypothetical protein